MDVDEELQDFIADHEITRENIVSINSYGVIGSSGTIHHYTKLIYKEPVKTTKYVCVNCDRIMETKYNPNSEECRCGSESWRELSNDEIIGGIQE